MLSYMKWAVNLTKSSLLRSACPSCSWDGTLAGGGKHPLLPCQSSRPTQTSKYSKKIKSGVSVTSGTQPSHSTPDPRTGISFWDVTATQLQERNGHSHCNSPPWIPLSGHQRKVAWTEQEGSSKAKPEDASKWQILRKTEFASFWLVIKRSTELFCTEGRDVTAQPGHHVAPAQAVTHGTGASSHHQMTGNNKGMPEADL